MSRLLIDPALPEGAKFTGASELAFSLHIKALCYCARALTDGFVPASKVYGLVHASKAAVDMALKHLTTTQPGCANPSWEIRPGGWYLHDYDDPQYMNPMRAEVQELTEKRRMAAQKGGLTSVKNRRQKYGSAQPVKNTIPEDDLSSAPEANVEPTPEALASTLTEPPTSGFASAAPDSSPKQTSKHPSRSQSNLPALRSTYTDVLRDRDTSFLSGDEVVHKPANGTAHSWNQVSQSVLVGHVSGWFLAWKGWGNIKADTRRDLLTDSQAMVQLGIPGDDLHDMLATVAAGHDPDEVNRLSFFWQPVQELQSERLKTSGRSHTRISGPTRLSESLPDIHHLKGARQ